MALRCCRDSVAGKVSTMHAAGTEPYDGQIVECRWCPDGYATFKAGEWVFSSYLTDRIERMTSPEATAERAARMRDILGKD